MRYGNSAYAEQPGSLAARLRDADIHHGDTADVELVGVGINTIGPAAVQTRLAFCPVTEVRVNPRAIYRGSAKERSQPIPELVRFSRKAREQIREDLYGRYGFATLACTIHSNGCIYVANLRLREFHQYGGTVNGTNSYRDFLAALPA